MPSIIIIDDPQTIAKTSYAEHYPSLDIAPIAQTELQDKKSTLKIILFEEIINQPSRIMPPDTGNAQTSHHANHR